MRVMKFYRYRPLTLRDHESLCNSTIFYADPAKFNDPLDSKPSISIDIDMDTLRYLFQHMWENERANVQDVREKMQQIKYDLTCPDIQDAVLYEQSVYRQEIEGILIDIMGKYRVLSLSRVNDSALMWSHYANSHEGMCVEYEISEEDVPDWFQKVIYGNERLISASCVYDWFVNANEKSRRKAFEVTFFHKANDWKYEQEWRHVVRDNGRPHRHSELDISGIYFGMKCPSYAIVSTVKLLDRGDNSVNFFQMKPEDRGFTLKPSRIDADEIRMLFPRQNIMKVFSKVNVDHQDID